MSAHRHETAPESATPAEKGAMRRRGLIAGAAALAAGVLAARMGDDVVEAADGSPMVVGPNTYTAATTTLTGAAATVPGFRVVSQGAATPDTTIDAVQGFATGANNTGVHGRNDALNGIGTTGVATNGTGAYGQSNAGSGVGGVSTSGAGVYGQSSGGTGVYGQSTGGNGVYGFANAAGASQVVAGVFGDSTTTYGLIGRTTASGFSGLTAITGTPNVAALAATSTNVNAFAAFFTGATVVQGNLSVTGQKNAAVPHKDGTHRLVYCVESPESWFEDFGEGRLVNGTANVTIDPEFAAIVHSDKYYIYVTPHGDTKGLHIAKQSAGGFTVQENQGGTSSVGFAWRAVAKRADITGERLAKFDLPKINIPDESKMPQPVPAEAHVGVAPIPKHKP